MTVITIATIICNNIEMTMKLTNRVTMFKSVCMKESKLKEKYL